MSGPETVAEDSGKQRRTFVPVALVGLAATGLASLAGHRPMLEVPADELKKQGVVAFAGEGLAEVDFPLAGALALVALACWGVLLVVRGRMRQAVAAAAALAAGGVFAVLVVGGFVQDDEASNAIADQLGVPGLADRLPLEWTPWFWLALVASVLATAAAVAAVLLAPEWPEMGKRYDAPSARREATTEAPAEERTNLDLWKSMDEGQDPTDDKPH